MGLGYSSPRIIEEAMGALKRDLEIPFHKRAIAGLELKAIPHERRALNQHSSLPSHGAGMTIVTPVCAQGCGTEQSEMKQRH